MGTSLRLILGARLPDYQANAILFVVAAAGFVLSASLALRIPRRQLGPDDVQLAKARDIVAGLAEALAHLRERRPAAIGLLTIGAHRVIYGIVTVATILVYRNYFHTLEQVEAAIADLGILVVITGAGFVFAAVVTPPMSARLGVRSWIVVCLVGSAVFQVFPGAFYAKIPLGIAAFLLGLTAQNIKICVDTLVQAHVARRLQGARLRALRHDLQRGPGARRGDRRGDPAHRRQVRVDLGDPGRRLPGRRGLVRRRQPRSEHEQGHRVVAGRRVPTHRPAARR